MAYLALARKWRPQTFKDFIGQSHIQTALQHALERKNIHHAYLFTGTRGVGKTSVARLFAKALSCMDGISAIPCNRCQHCQSITQGQFLDLIEIDAASKTKIEDTRELLNQVSYPPSLGRYKIYLIDEVHMLSTHSFNALLKTLEEPPEKTMFLLATTDPEKLPTTIQSRCLQLHLHHVATNQIAQHLGNILKKEQIQYNEEGLILLAKAAQGSIRDALSLLEQALALSPHDSDQNIQILSQEHITHMLGTMPDKDIQSLLIDICEQNIENVRNKVDSLLQHNYNFKAIIDQILSYLYHTNQNLIFDPNNAKETSLPISHQQCHVYIQLTLKARQELDQYPYHHMGFTMLIMRMLSLKLSEGNLQSIIMQQVAALEPKSNHRAPDVLTKREKKTPQATPNATPAPTAPTSIDNWEELITSIPIKGLAKSLITQCTLESNWNDHNWSILMPVTQQSLLTSATKSSIEKAITQMLPRIQKIQFKTTEKKTKTIATTITTATTTKTKTPLNLEQDTLLQSIQSTLKAEIEH
ncbi:MAG: DNA polymerase III subunit gamma/tau [Pseudomonadota bacterium]|nr:DNA polymerase III subunit gamma/tau [Pseudomonadota bacterium]